MDMYQKEEILWKSVWFLIPLKSLALNPQGKKGDESGPFRQHWRVQKTIRRIQVDGTLRRLIIIT